ncbi:MAG TPA: PAS domain S-box protein [Candidatus Paceibacterota bacterium]|nr:PAS domain S-box protein [Candidatus Paceibacterota bacterium]
MSDEHPQSQEEAIAHANVLVQRGRELDQKLVAMELLMSRYQASHGIALLFSRVNEGANALLDFTEYLVREMHFQKVCVLRVGAAVSLIAQSGFSFDEIASYLKESEMVKKKFSEFWVASSETDAAMLVQVSPLETEKMIFGLSRFLIGYTPDGDDRLYIIAGYDTGKGALYENKYPLSDSDVFWFSQLVLLSGSFLIKMRLINELKQKASENLTIAEQREKQIEERTRALLDALFDAKKFRLVIERADMLVALIDSASHRFIFVNTLWEQLTGYSRDEVVGKKTFEFLHLEPLERQPKMFSSEFDAQIAGEGSYRGSFVLTDKNGDEQALSLSLSRMEDGAGGMLYVVIGRDIREDRERLARERSHFEEVEKLNQLMINRELRIIELKRQVSGKLSQ